MKMLLSGGFITSQEEPQVKSVLSAAAMTYVAAAITSLLQLLVAFGVLNNPTSKSSF